MSTPKLFDLSQLPRRRSRATQHGMFLQVLARDEIIERLQGINRTFTSVAVVTGFYEVWKNCLKNTQVFADCETLGLGHQQFDLVIHALTLHSSNDPVGQVIQCANALKPDGLFLGSCFGGQTLAQLRSAISTAEAEITGGLSPRISPMAEIRDLGAILQRAGLALPVADNLDISVSHESLPHLAKDLRAMGETNIMHARSKSFSRRALFEKTENILKSEFLDGSGRILSTFDLIFLSGWAPHKDQPQPLQPGSVNKSLLDAIQDAKSTSED